MSTKANTIMIVCAEFGYSSAIQLARDTCFRYYVTPGIKGDSYMMFLFHDDSILQHDDCGGEQSLKTYTPQGT